MKGFLGYGKGELLWKSYQGTEKASGYGKGIRVGNVIRVWKMHQGGEKVTRCRKCVRVWRRFLRSDSILYEKDVRVRKRGKGWRFLRGDSDKKGIV